MTINDTGDFSIGADGFNFFAPQLSRAGGKGDCFHFVVRLYQVGRGLGSRLLGTDCYLKTFSRVCSRASTSAWISFNSSGEIGPAVTRSLRVSGTSRIIGKWPRLQVTDNSIVRFNSKA